MSDEEFLTPRERKALANNPQAKLTEFPQTDDEIEKQELTGVGGFLGFLVLVLMFISPVLGAAVTYSEHQMLSTNNPAFTEGSVWQTILIVDWASVAISTALGFLACWLLLKRQMRSTVWLVIALIWLSSVGVSTASLFVFDNLMPNGIGASHAGSVLGRPIIFCIIWTMYLLISKRVKRTYL